MKNKYSIMFDTGRFDGKPAKTFKNESDAIAFYNSQKNFRQYGVMSLTKKDSGGNTYFYNELSNSWEE